MYILYKIAKTLLSLVRYLAYDAKCLSKEQMELAEELFTKYEIYVKPYYKNAE